MDKLTVREWILIIALMMLTEYLVSSNSYTFKDDQTVLNYISFASTIASILLAVIAIIYGFLQSDSSSKANNKLLDSLSEFKKIHGKILRNSQKSEKQLDRLSSITDILERLNVSMEHSSSKMSIMENHLLQLHKSSESVKDEITKLSDIKNASTTEKETKNDFSIARIILRRSSIYADFIAYALNKINNDHEKISMSGLGTKYLVPIKNFVDEDSKLLFDEKVIYASIFVIVNTLKGANLISINKPDESIIISEDLSKELPVFAEEIKQLDIELSKIVTKTIDSL